MHCLPALSFVEQRYIKALRQPLLTIVSEPVPSRVMRKFVCRCWLNEVSQQ